MDDGLQQRAEGNRSLASFLAGSIDYRKYICYRVNGRRNRMLQMKAANEECVAPDESGGPAAEAADCLIGGDPLCYGLAADSVSALVSTRWGERNWLSAEAKC